ncbi:hypothetical protein [Bergeyella zoohelcum]|uniref:hypothetical protein n=1 Tax=Bergeyella zoohelcum TaxID=1015 RepID=UPI002A9171FD|nr:hypothetical protein [Bergeyella zoohelcum]MDY6024695.1 hypothetical protein [Bergeyella zoohelcum]
MKKWLKKSLIALGVLAGVLLLLNIGFNIWLQKGLPHLIKKKTEYQVHYQSLSVDIFTGNISAHAINIKTLPNNNLKIPKIEGTVEQIEIGRLGLYDAIFNNEISSSRLNIVRPHLTILPWYCLLKAMRRKRKIPPLPWMNYKLPRDISLSFVMIIRNYFLPKSYPLRQKISQ